MSRASPYRRGVGAAGGGGIGSTSGVYSPAAQFDQYAGRSDSEHSGGGATGPLGTPAHVHTLKKQKERRSAGPSGGERGSGGSSATSRWPSGDAHTHLT